MLDNLYADIGGKIKGWAKWIFTIEAIGAIIIGIAMIGEDIDFWGFLVIFLGPIVAWVSSWLLYAFGELVEDVHDLRNMEKAKERERTKVKTEEQARQTTIQPTPNQDAQFRSLVNALKETSSEKDPNKGNAPVVAEIKDGEKICPKCGKSQKADRRVCWSCGQPFEN